MSTQFASQKFTEYVKASEIWPTAKDFEDKGPRPGLVRGYNVEIKTRHGIIDWMSCSYISEDTPEEYFLGEFYTFYLNDLGFELTGRICFRGYGREEYDPDERDTFIIPVNI